MRLQRQLRPTTPTRVLAPALFFALMSGPAAQARNEPTPVEDPIKPYFVGQIVVTSDPEDPADAAADVEVLENEELQKLGVRNVAEALEHMTGLSGSTGSRNEHMIWVRGYNQAQTLVLVDGIPVADPYSGEVDLGRIPVSDVARIVATRSGASPVYGPNALGGVINIVTFQGNTGRVTEADLRLSDNDTILGHASTGGRSGSMDWYVGAGIGESDGYGLSDDFQAQSYEDGDLRVNSDYQTLSFSGRLGFDVGAHDRVTATFRLLDTEKGVPFHTSRPTGFIKFSRFPQ